MVRGPKNPFWMLGAPFIGAGTLVDFIKIRQIEQVLYLLQKKERKNKSWQDF